MSAEPPSAPYPAADQLSVAETNAQPRKSYRRKYRKIMVKFEDCMQHSNGLFRDEQRIFDISQRLAEQVDQTLAILLELNECPQIPKGLRYDLKEAHAKTASNKHYDTQEAHEAMRVGRNRVQKGELTPFEYEQQQSELLDTSEFAPVGSYQRHMKNKPVKTSSRDILSDLTTSSSKSYLSIKQEEQYLQSLDTFLNGKSPNPRSHAANTLGSRTAEKTADREREMQLKNPVSVYNWLRKHQPQVFLQDHEAGTEKSSKTHASRTSKRTTGKADKHDNDYYDEDGIAVDQTAASRGKRKRDDDGAFRPKGGKGGHLIGKRRKEDGGGGVGSGGGGKKSKRSSMDIRAS